MKKTIVLIALIVLCAANPAHALRRVVSCSEAGAWPKNWPKELDLLRDQSRKHVFSPIVLPNEPPVTHTQLTFEIQFADREQFESAWPHILALKNERVALTLLPVGEIRVQTGNAVGIEKTSGVRILVSVPISPGDPKVPDRPLHGINNPNALGPAIPPEYVTGIQLVVDGDIVDLNRIRLPADTPISDNRFSNKEAATEPSVAR